MQPLIQPHQFVEILDALGLWPTPHECQQLIPDESRTVIVYALHALLSVINLLLQAKKAAP